MIIINLGVALSNFWQLARYLKMGEKAMLMLPCEARSIYKQLSAVLGHLDRHHLNKGLK